MQMANVIGMVLVLGLIFSTAFFQFSILAWTALFSVVLLLLSLFVPMSIALLCFFWIIFLAIAAFCNLHRLRRQYFISPTLKILRKQMPSISKTEREAIEAGNTWWEKELFCGKPKWKNLLHFSKPSLTTEEQSFLNNQVETLCKMLDDWRIVYTDKNMPPEVWDYLKKEKFFGMVIPKKFGGLGFSALAHSTIVVKIATRSLSTAVNTMVPNSLGPGELLLQYGTDEQKQYYLPKLAQGEEIPCFALTAPDAGSDAGAIPDTGIICKGNYNGQEILGIRLTWDKRYITLAPVATVLGLAFHMYDPDHLLGEVDDIGITLCLLPTNHPGVEIGNRHYPVYQAFMNGPTRGKDVFIPLDWIIGGPKMAGQGWRMLMECLSIGRSISLPALATACGNITYRFTGAYARIRRQFNTSIAHFEGVEEALSRIAGGMYTLEATRVMTAGAVDQHIKPAIASAIAKYHMTELSRQVIAHGMDIHAGHMIQIGPRNFLANAHFALPISITVEGANILTRNLIIFGQGAIRCHPYLLKEVTIISSPQPQIEELDKVLMAHMGFFASNVLRNLAYSWTGGLFIFTNFKNKHIKYYQRQLTRMSTALALLADTSVILLGGSLKRRENLSARLGDILSQLYISSAVLKYFYDNNQSKNDVDYVCWAIQDSLNKIQIACDDVLHNFPNRFVASLLSFLIFPFGRSYKPVRDTLGKKIVEDMLNPTELRERLTKNCFISTNENELTARLEKAFHKLNTIEPLAKKLQQAIKAKAIQNHPNYQDKLLAAQNVGVLTSEEANILAEYEVLKNEIIKVNEFSFDLKEVIA